MRRVLPALAVLVAAALHLPAAPLPAQVRAEYGVMQTQRQPPETASPR